MSRKIVVAQPVHRSVTEVLQPFADLWINPGPGPVPTDELARHCSDADAMMAFMTERIDAAFIAHCPQLKIIAGALKGYNNMDVEACSQNGVCVTVVPDLLTEPTAELTVGLMISLARNVIEGDRYVRSGAFEGWSPRFYGGSLCGASVLVIGAGAVGQTVMRMLGGFGCELSYVDKRALEDDEEKRYGCRRVMLREGLHRADFVVLAIHLMPETHHFVSDDFLAQMKDGGYLVNPSRGSVVDEAAVERALASGRLAGYAADTFEMEDWAVNTRRLSIGDGLLTCGQTILTPHIGSAVRAVREQIEMSAANSIIDVFEGKPPQGLVNSEALTRSSQRSSDHAQS